MPDHQILKDMLHDDNKLQLNISGGGVKIVGRISHQSFSPRTPGDIIFSP